MEPLFLAAALCAVGSGALARDDTDDPAKAAASKSAPVKSSLQRGDMEIAAITGFGIAHDIWEGEPGVRFLVLGARVGYVLCGPKGPGFLRGNLEVAGEVLPAFWVDPGNTTYGAALTLLGRHFFMPQSGWRPYAVLGIGALETMRRIPVDSARFNFTLQAGMGVRFDFHGKLAFYAEYRIHHISAGAKTAAENPGINSSYVQFSASVYRW